MNVFVIEDHHFKQQEVISLLTEDGNTRKRKLVVNMAYQPRTVVGDKRKRPDGIYLSFKNGPVYNTKAVHGVDFIFLGETI
jgi:hypothetical protein